MVGVVVIVLVVKGLNIFELLVSSCIARFTFIPKRISKLKRQTNSIPYKQKQLTKKKQIFKQTK